MKSVHLPPLESARLRVVPFDATFLTERYVGWLNDPEVVRHSEQRHRRHTLESCAAYWRSIEASPHFFCAILKKDDGEHVGNMTVVMDIPNQVADMALMIGEKQYWGSGFGSEAWFAMMQELFSSHPVRKITAGTMATNQGMLAVMQKSGMAEEGRRSRHFLWEGQEVDMVMAAKFRD